MEYMIYSLYKRALDYGYKLKVCPGAHNCYRIKAYTEYGIGGKELGIIVTIVYDEKEQRNRYSFVYV